MLRNFIVALVVVSASAAFAVDRTEDFKLSPAPRFVRGVVESDAFSPFGLPSWRNTASDLKKLIGFQTSVKSQGHRGTCSIFSSIAEVESLLKIRNGKEYDLSENYLEYLIMSKIKSSPSEGSDTEWNIPALQQYGALFESTWPYEEDDWTGDDFSSDVQAKISSTCGHVVGKNNKACLLGHMDPSNDQFSDEAEKVARELGTSSLTYQTIGNQNEIKQALDNNQPLTLGLRFFYKAWNHRKMTEYGLGERDMNAWAHGTVSTPTAQDIQLSSKHSAGHSIVVVGYDDAKRVYYFKNSWGTGNFGAVSNFLGNGSTDGYGTITYDYAHRYGTFNKVSFGRK